MKIAHQSGYCRNGIVSVQWTQLVPQILMVLMIGAIYATAAEEPASAGPIHSWGTDVFGLTSFPEGIENEEIVAVSAGGMMSLALTKDGRIYAWGREHETYGYIEVPPELDGLEVIQIDAGYEHSLALTADGVVYGWGNWAGGKLPVPEVPDWAESGLQSVSAGRVQSVALGIDPSRFWYWGQPGGSIAGRVEMPENAGYKAIVAGSYHCLAITNDGRVVGWGDNSRDQVDIPEELADGTRRVKKVAAGLYHSLAVTEDGQLWGWGYDQYEEASKYHLVYGFKDVAAGDQFSLALTVVDTVLAWGYNHNSQAEPPDKLTDRHHPDFVPVVGISAGFRHALAVTMSAKVAMPVISTEPFATQVNVTLACETKGASIYYTLDGSEPTIEDGTPYGGAFPIAVIEPGTFKARAFKEGYFPSEIAEEEMIFSGRAITVSHVEFGSVAIGETASGKILIRNKGQLASAIVSVSIDSEDEEVFKVYFSSMVHLAPGEAIEVNTSFGPDGIGLFEGEIQIATDSDTRILGSEPVVTGTGIPPPPGAAKASGEYPNAVPIDLYGYPAVEIWYRLFTDAWGPWTHYERGVAIEELGTTKLEAKSILGGLESDVAEYSYTVFKLTVSSGSLEFEDVAIGTRVERTISLTYEGDPGRNLTGTQYVNAVFMESEVFGDAVSWPIALVPGEAVSYQGFFEPNRVGGESGYVSFFFDSGRPLTVYFSGTGYAPSQVVQPTILPDPEGGPYWWAIDVTMTSGTAGSITRYTLDGSEPHEESMRYDGYPFSLSTRGTTTVKARSFKTGWSASEATVAAYTINTIKIGRATTGTENPGKLGLSIGDKGIGRVIGFLEDGESVFALLIKINKAGKILKMGTLFTRAKGLSGGSPASIDDSRSPVAFDEDEPEIIGEVDSDGSLTFELSGVGSFSGEVDPLNGDAAGLAGGYEMDLLYGNAGSCYAVVSSDGSVIVVIDGPDGTHGCHGLLDENGHAVMTTDAGSSVGVTIGSGHSMAVQLTPQGSNTPIEYAGLGAGETGSNRLVNLSTRGHVGIGAQNMIAGFVITGTGSKPVLIRAMGPTLAESFGMGGTVADPMIEVIPLGGTTVVASNDDWENTQAMLDAIASTGAFAAHAVGSQDAMLLTQLDPGGYTATISGVGDTEGVAIVEVYAVDDLDTPEARQVNISTRGFIGAGDSVMIMGLVASGNTPRQFLIRAVGPTLSEFGITGVLEDPVLSVVRQTDQVEVATNDDWDAGTAGDEIVAMSQQLGAFDLPRGSKDAVLLISLPPTSPFTVVISGKNGATGVAIAEVYEVP